MMEPNRNLRIVRADQEDALTEKQLLDYYDQRKAFLTWLLRMGKNPDKAEGYSPYTVKGTADRTARFDKWVWDHRGGYTLPPTEDDATAYMEEVAFWDVVESTKGKQLEALLRYNQWLQRQFGVDEWEFDWAFQSGGGNNAPRDFLTREERRQIRQAALEKDGNPTYGIDEDSKEHSWRYTSLVWVSLETGLRPVEVGEARVSWCDTENGVLRIPREESSKNQGNWTVGLTDRTTKVLDRWLSERADHPKYEESDRLWLTRHGNRYGSNELRRLLVDLCERAGIAHEDRQMSWYTIRHSVRTYMTKERDLAAAFDHCREYLVREVEAVDPTVLVTLGEDTAIRLLNTVFDIHVRSLKPGTRDCGEIYRTDPPVVISPHWSHGWLDRSPTGPRNLDLVQEAVVDIYRDRTA